MKLKDISCQAIQSKLRTQGFKYRSESGINQVGYEIYQYFFIHSIYPVGIGSPLGVLDHPSGVANQVYLDFLLTVGTRASQILEQVCDSHTLAVLYEGIHDVGQNILQNPHHCRPIEIKTPPFPRCHRCQLWRRQWGREWHLQKRRRLGWPNF